MPPDPHRDPGPGRVDHLHHHTPMTLSVPHNLGTRQLVARLSIERRASQGANRTQVGLQVDRADHTDHSSQATQSSSRRVRHCRVLDDSGGRSRSSSGPRPHTTPTNGHPHSTPEEPLMGNARRAMAAIRNPHYKHPRLSYHLLPATIASTAAIRASDTTSQHLLPHLHVPLITSRPRPARHVAHSNQGSQRSRK